ncbi:MAG: transglycosylase domain-containing protein [Pseudomonadota bacterium]
MIKGMVFLLLVALLATAGYYEVETSWLQARLFSAYSSKLTWQVSDGPSGNIIFPEVGPYNERQGYTALKTTTENLRKRGFDISQQARFSLPLRTYVQMGGNPPYQEKQQAGLTILDDAGAPLYISRQPGRIYPTFESIPELLVQSLLFIENRDLLTTEQAKLNPAVEWFRLGKVMTAHTANLFEEGHDAAGASTLATQLEKYRYSPEGLTSGIEEKLHQMVSAAVRAYRDGPDTSEARERIVRDYINSTPLSGRVGFGEILGIGEGLWAWYGMDFIEANALLSSNEKSVLDEKARVFKAALSLVLSQRRPSYYLLDGREELAQLTDSHLRLLGNAGVIDAQLMNAAISQPLIFRDGMPVKESPSYIRQKAVNSVRTELLSLLNSQSLYDLDRLDLTVKTTIASEVQENVTQVLQNITDPVQATAMGLTGYRLLQEDQLDAVRFSVLIYESTPDGNKLRVQTDNLNVPFDLNDDSKLDLGSTAKLRTLLTYLEIVEKLYYRYSNRLDGTQVQPGDVAVDPIRLWVVDQLRATPNLTLQELLDAAMLRQYSASNTELFFTAGGQHRFNNFESEDNSRVMSVAEAFNRSVNLVFIRMMRDISRYYINEIPGIRDLLDNRDNPLRQQYLARFADQEGREYMQQFYNTYRGQSGEQLIDTLATHTPATPYRLAMTFRTVQPEADITAMTAFVAQRLDAEKMPDSTELNKLFTKYARDKFNSNDRAYLAGVHPLELWMVEYLLANPGTPFDELVRASTEQRQEAYAWLFKTDSWDKQQKRIRILVEQDSFVAIHQQWQKLGYPFPTLVPSYATALGVSADRPTALTELMGIIVNDGLRISMGQIESLQFAADTPYETVLQARTRVGEQVLSPQVTGTARSALIGIVESGTGRRLSGVFLGPDGQPLAVGGKTGTGDHRSRQFAAGGRLISETVVNRNAIFTFFIDDRFFGTILASVGGPEAEDFEFTSGLASQLLKVLQPALQPLLQEDKDLLTRRPIDTVAQNTR